MRLEGFPQLCGVHTREPSQAALSLSLHVLCHHHVLQLGIGVRAGRGPSGLQVSWIQAFLLLPFSLKCIVLSLLLTFVSKVQPPRSSLETGESQMQKVSTLAAH